jgi:hypothetical protein
MEKPDTFISGVILLMFFFLCSLWIQNSELREENLSLSKKMSFSKKEQEVIHHENRELRKVILELQSVERVGIGQIFALGGVEL